MEYTGLAGCRSYILHVGWAGCMLYVRCMENAGWAGWRLYICYTQVGQVEGSLYGKHRLGRERGRLGGRQGGCEQRWTKVSLH